MFLIQSWQLKHKTLPTHRFRLPSLEWLERLNYRSVVASGAMFGIGVGSGLVLDRIYRSQGRDGLDWRDPVVWSYAIFFMWLTAVLVFGACYKPARQGRKVAYFTVSNFLLLAMVLAITLWSPGEHGVNEVGSGWEASGCGSAAERHLSPPQLVHRRPRAPRF
jgi:hypothetical protein